LLPMFISSSKKASSTSALSPKSPRLILLVLAILPEEGGGAGRGWGGDFSLCWGGGDGGEVRTGCWKK
jgi:hypothetical protein